MVYIFKIIYFWVLCTRFLIITVTSERERDCSLRKTSEISDGVSLSLWTHSHLFSFPLFHSLDLPLYLSSWAPSVCLNSHLVLGVRRSTCDLLLFTGLLFYFTILSAPASQCLCICICSLSISPSQFPFFVHPRFRSILISILPHASLSLLALLHTYMTKKKTHEMSIASWKGSCFGMSSRWIHRSECSTELWNGL